MDSCSCGSGFLCGSGCAWMHSIATHEHIGFGIGIVPIPVGDGIGVVAVPIPVGNAIV